MKNLLIVLGLVCVIACVSNAQSKDCCSGNGDKTKVEKCSDNHSTMKSGGNVETSTTTSTVKDGKETLTKEVVVKKVDSKVECNTTSSCCSGDKEKKVEKDTQKKETK